MRPGATLACLLALALAAPAAAGAQAPGPDARIAPAVSAAGVDVSGLTLHDAADRINASFRGRLERGIAVRAAGRTLRLSARGARLSFDHVRTASRAYYAGRDRSAPAPGAEPAAVDVPLALTHSAGAVNRFAARVDRALSRAARDATLRITLRRVRVRRSRPGRDIDERALAGQISAALAAPGASRVFRPALVPVRARVNANDLRRRAGTVLTIDRSNFKLRLFKRTRLRRTYRIAVGLPAYPTPTGRFAIQSKQVNPTWSVPNSDWAGELAGTTVVGGSAANPLKARWMGIANGVGIHGTGQEYSIGSRASHGCIRMRVADVIDLFRRVPVGTPVLIR